MFNFRREPATLLMGVISPVIAAVSAFVLASRPDVQGAVNVAAVAVTGAITAYLVRSDKLLPAVTAAIQAIIHMVTAWGLDWTSAQQAQLQIALAAVFAYVVRDRVTAPAPAVETAAFRPAG